MADWSLIESTLEAWVLDVTGLPTYWRGRPGAPSFSNNGYALLQITGRRTRGIDEVQTEYDNTQAAGEEIRSWQSGQRIFTFTVQIRTQRQAVDVDAKNYTSLLRDSTRLPQKTVAPLAAASIAIASVIAETDISDTLDDRDLSIAQIDIRMNAGALTEDTKTGYIETIKDATFEAPEGTPRWTGDFELQ
jgi:hypothetical protein